VARARARRLLREMFRLHQHDFAQPVDFVLVAQRSIAGKRLGDLEEPFMALMRKSGLLKNA
jgi:ribonuclease P protein component